MTRARGVWSAGAVLALGVSAGAQAPGGGPPPATVVLDAVRSEVVEQYRPVTGELQAVRRSLLAAEEEGLVLELLQEEGDSVKQGDVIARLRDTRARLEVARATADLAVKQANVLESTADLERSQQDVERLQTLTTQSSAAWKELEDRKADVAMAQARLAAAQADAVAAEAALDWAREQLARMVITAPFEGRIISKRTEVGQWLQKGDGVVELLEIGRIDARLDVPERFVQRIAGMSDPIQIRLTATGETFRAPATALIPEADSRSRLFPLKVRIQNTDGKLRPGMSIVGLLPSGSSEAAITVHKDALLRDDAGEFVYFSGGGRAAVARVTTLFPVGNRVAVQAGTLQPGMQVVIQGNERLMPGQPLMPAGGPAQANAQPPASAPSANPEHGR
jgi:membrane fusion protein (multidrug efflux system)